jgi:hypothetical protein
MKEAHDVALRGLVAVTQVALTEDYTHRFAGIRQALSTAVFLLERNDCKGLSYLDTAIECMINRFGHQVARQMLKGPRR